MSMMSLVSLNLSDLPVDVGGCSAGSLSVAVFTSL